MDFGITAGAVESVPAAEGVNTKRITPENCIFNLSFVVAKFCGPGRSALIKMEKEFKNEKLKALLLCGGKGERLRPLTESLPKPLIPVGEKPILHYLIEHLGTFGLDDLIVATGYKSQRIVSYLARHHREIAPKIIDSGDVDIIQRMKEAAAHIPGDFLMFYGDTLSDVNLDELIAFHRRRKQCATVTVWPLQCPFGVLEVDAMGGISSYKEKPILDKWINIGHFYFRHAILDWLEGCVHFEDLLSRLVEEKQLNGFRHRGVHITVNTVHELREAEKNIGKFVALCGGRKKSGKK